MPEKSPDRIAILGFPGSGKTTVARQLASQYALPHIELDMYRQNDQIIDNVVREIAEGDQWILEGIRRGDSIDDTVPSRADVIYWLDIPLFTIARQTKV